MSKLSRLSHPRIRITGEPTADASTQVYYWPRRMESLSTWATAAGVFGLLGGLILVSNRTEAEELALMTGGLLSAVGGAALLLCVAIAHACLAREIHFHRLYCIIRQTGREDLILPYCGYDDQWVVDFSRPKSLRIVVTDSHRGCTILTPDEWMRVAFQEIARIQEEEGWPEPE
jgi:hypothetical protein